MLYAENQQNTCVTSVSHIYHVNYSILTNFTNRKMPFLSQFKSSPIFFLLLSAFCTAIFSNPRYITDSYEYAIIASCWADSAFIGMDCSQINYYFRQPFPSFLVLLSSPILEPFIGIGFWSWVASTIVLWQVWFVGKSIFSERLAIWLWIAVAASPFLRHLNSFADSRIIALPLIFWAGYSLLLPERNRWIIFSGALACVLAFLTRTEALLLLPIFLFFQILLKRGYWNVTSVLFGFCIGIWLLGIWSQGGIFSISPRYWEGFLLQTTERMPLRWSLDLFGMGIWSPPLRRIAIEQAPISMPLASINFQEWLQWLNLSIFSYFPIWAWSILALALGNKLRKREVSSQFWILCSLTLPSLVITILPQARDFMFPHANSFPVWLIGLLGIIWGIEQISHILPKLWSHGFMALGITLLTCFSNPVHLDSGVEFFPIAQKTTTWLETHTPENSIVLSSYELAPIVFLSGRRWEQWPSPFEWDLRLETDTPVYALVSRIDPHAQNPLAFTEWKEPTAYFRDQENEFLVIQLR